MAILEQVPILPLATSAVDPLPLMGTSLSVREAECSPSAWRRWRGTPQGRVFTRLEISSIEGQLVALTCGIIFFMVSIKFQNSVVVE